MKGVAFRNPRNVVIVQRRAGLGDRIVATLLDYAVMGGYLFLLLFPDELRRFIDHHTSISILITLPLLFYHLLWETLFNGRSVGKSARRTRVMKLDGSPPDLGAYLMRWLFRIVDALFTWAIGVISVIVTKNGQRLGDIAAGTTVIKEARPPSIDDIWQAPEPGRKLHHPEASLLTDQELALLKEALERAERKKGELPLQKVLHGVKARTGIASSREDRELARTLIADHDHLMRERGG